MFAAVVPGYQLQFPRDFGSHDSFRTEWWYVTGWVETPQHESLGFQVTFFRTRLRAEDRQKNPSAFAAQQIFASHVAISDAAHGGLWLDQKVARAAFSLAGAATDDTRVWIDRWRLQREGEIYRTSIAANGFSFDLDLVPTQPALLEGHGGFSQKAPAAKSASYYYSIPHLQVNGQMRRDSRRSAVRGEAWLDHEWSSDYLDAAAVGWDWIGLNLNDGSALMAFRIRGRDKQTLWAGGSLQSSRGDVTRFAPDRISFSPRREWRSPLTGIAYPVAMAVRVGDRQFALDPLLDAQESDTRLSTGSIYWEGAVRATEGIRPIGRGYLELTGYGEPLLLH